jgi:hypothetical protein
MVHQMCTRGSKNKCATGNLSPSGGIIG